MSAFGGKADINSDTACPYGTFFNINAKMVGNGWALAYRKYSKDYVSEETLAKSRREGMWRGEFEPPWEWRRKRK